MARPKNEENSVEPIVEDGVEDGRIEIGKGIFLTQNKNGAAVYIECKPADKVKAASDAFSYLQGLSFDGVIVENEKCHTSIKYDRIETFPTQNVRCGCGSKEHAFVMYRFI